MRHALVYGYGRVPSVGKTTVILGTISSCAETMIAGWPRLLSSSLRRSPPDDHPLNRRRHYVRRRRGRPYLTNRGVCGNMVASRHGEEQGTECGKSKR